jgi:hypothetical protein
MKSSIPTMLLLVLVAVLSLATIFRDDKCPASDVVMGSGGPGTAAIPGIHIGQ